MSRFLKVLLAIICLCVMASEVLAAKPKGLLAEWNFDEGKGNVARDSSGNGHDAQIFEGEWVKQGDGFALNLDGRDDYVDCGESQALGLNGPITIEAWIKPTRHTPDNAVLFGENLGTYLVTYYGKDLHWYIAHKTKTNYLNMPTNLHEWSHVVVTFDNDRLEIWINGRRVASRDTAVKSYTPGGHFWICVKGRPDLPHYKGMVDRVRLYNRGLTAEEVVTHFRDESSGYDFDPIWFKRVKVIPYYYLDRGEITIEADYKGLQPFDGKARLEVTLAAKENPNKIIEQQVIDSLCSRSGVTEVTLHCDKLADDDYIIRVVLSDGKGARPVEELAFSYPDKPQPLISPTTKTAAALPPKHEPSPFCVKVGQGGGFTITIKNGSYPFISRISWPNGDFNHLSTGDAPFIGGEKSWKANVRAIGKNKYEVKASGEFYTIQREIEVFPTHVYVKDKYTNITDDDLGLLIYNETPVKPGQVTESLLSGLDKRGRQRDGRVPDFSPSVFITDANTGMGMVPIDDVFVIQSMPYIEWQDAVGLGNEKFALAPGKSYALEWAVYPTGSSDYYDFINNFRTVEDRISAIKGGLSFISYGPDSRRQVPSKDFIEKQGISIGMIAGLAGAADDPQISIQGIEYMDFPIERELLRRQVAAIHKRHPMFKVIFHIAHSIYTTNKPERFADSRVIGSNGEHALWGYGYDYISKERQDKGWKGWIFYPAPGNSFHDALMKSADIAMDEMGMDGVFMDGFLMGMISRWTYDRWDGHSAEIDLQTKTIKRKMGSVLLLSQPSMIEFARKIHNKGGLVIANNAVNTRSIANQKYIIHDRESGAGPSLHLAPNMMGLGRGGGNEKVMYLDILDTLRWGVTYMGYYVPRAVGHDLTRPLMSAKQFPITFEEIRSGLVRGKERIVTMNSGAYGWREHLDLHMVYKYDGRGVQVSHDFITTVDKTGVRTELKFGKNESAVIEPIPISLEANASVNVRVLQYDYPNDKLAFKVLLNGQGEATLVAFVGRKYFPGRNLYRIMTGGETTTITERDGTLSVPLELDGQLEVTIERADRGA